MRGKVAYTDLQRPSPGITPAYAGKSGPCPDRVPPAGDHPRVCGEKSQSTSASPRALGSPPRMRGKGVKQSNSRIRMGITPAYAGKSKRIAPSSVLFGDHPRVCGEKLRESRGLNRTRGSPPRMRGKVVQFRPCPPSSRITPAYAGKSSTLLNFSTTERDHPRVCGEKFPPLSVLYIFLGSPPRMRGKGKVRRTFLPASGITPAYAGKSQSVRLPFQSLWDHPRVCGEKRFGT